MSIKSQLTENVKILQKAVVIRNSDSVPEVLLLKRSADTISRPSCWDLPGGNSEWPKEQASFANLHLQDIKREIFEETSLVVASALFQLDNFALTNRADIQISHEHQQYLWIKEQDIANYDVGGQKGVFISDMVQKAFAKFNHCS